MKPGRTGIARLLSATRYSWRGIGAAFRNEAAFRQELLLFVVLFAASFEVAGDPVEWLLLVLPLFVLLIVELLNSAIEAIVDRVGPERHELSGRAKDMGSAAVLFSLLMLAAAWTPLLWSYFND
jgi:diacylglycerol kinase (ATP)